MSSGLLQIKTCSLLEAQGQMEAKVVHVSDATSNQGSTEWLASDFLAHDLGFSHWF